MYKHAISWPASFVERSPKRLRPQLEAAAAIAKAFGMKPTAFKKSRALRNRGKTVQCACRPKLAPVIQRVGSRSAPTATAGKLQIELQRYLAHASATCDVTH